MSKKCYEFSGQRLLWVDDVYAAEMEGFETPSFGDADKSVAQGDYDCAVSDELEELIGARSPLRALYAEEGCWR